MTHNADYQRSCIGALGHAFDKLHYVFQSIGTAI